MLLLAWILEDWPARLAEVCRVCSVTFSDFKTRISNERLKWLRPIPLRKTESELSHLTDKSGYGPPKGLSLGELIKAEPEVARQFEVVGISEEQLSRSALSDQEWEVVRDIFQGEARWRSSPEGLLSHRATLGLILLVIESEELNFPRPDLPPILVGRVANNYMNWKGCGWLREFFSRMDRGHNPSTLNSNDLCS